MEITRTDIGLRPAVYSELTVMAVFFRGALLLAAMLFLSACSDGIGETYSSTSTSSSSPGPNPAPAPSPGPGPAPAPSPGPTLNLSAASATINSNDSTSLSWSTTEATSCSASGAWSGNKPTSGSQTIGPLSVTSTYTLNCSGPGGSVTRSTTVTVVATVAYTVETSWAPNTDNPDGYHVYIGGSSNTVNSLARTLVRGASDWNPASPLVQIPSNTVLAAVGSSNQVCVQIRAYNVAGVSTPSEATCAAIP